MSIIDHLEIFLGSIQEGWKDNDSSFGLQVVSFKDRPIKGVSTFTSLGMSKEILRISDEREVRQELVFTVHSMAISRLIVSCLMSLCEAILNRNEAVLRGEVIPLSAELSQRIGFSFVYCAIPVVFDDEFCTYGDSCPSTVMVWIFPIFDSEAEYIEANGWEKFEDLLEAHDPDLFSLERSSVV